MSAIRWASAAVGVAAVGGVGWAGWHALYGLAAPFFALGVAALAVITRSSGVAAAALMLGAAVAASYAGEALLRTALSDVVVPWSARGVDFAALALRSAQKARRSYDERPLSEVILSARARTPRVYPGSSPSHYLRAAEDGGLVSAIRLAGAEVLPLGLAPRAVHAYCNESGQYPFYRTDPHGFVNPEGVWDEAPVDLMLLGDSFTFGACVPAEQSYAGRLRARWPRTINLGMSANGPLFNLAGLSEYGPELEPANVVWFHFENDVEDLVRERRSPLLRRYLESGFSQGLYSRRQEVGDAVDAFIEAYWADVLGHERTAAQLPARPFAGEHWGFVSMRRLGALLGQAYAAVRPSAGALPVSTGTGQGATGPEEHAAYFERVLRAARDRVQGWGGRLHFVYLPDCVSLQARGRARADEYYRRRVLEVVRSLGLSLIDLGAELAQEDGALDRFYYYCPGSHFNEAGHARVAQAVSAALRDSGLPPR